MKLQLNETQFAQLISLINQKANEADINPTLPQKEAGNYRMGHIRVGGFNITIENPKGSYRTFKKTDGSIGKIQMKHHYGYFTKTLGKDGDAIDVFVGPYLDFTEVFVVDQFVKGQFDESKVMLGFSSIENAKQAYFANFNSDWKGFRKITAVDIDFFKEWLYDGLKQRKPFYEYVDVKKKKIAQLKEWINEMKLDLDKYYTPDSEAEKCIEIFKQTAEEKGWDITEYFEPSAGSGAFSNRLDNCVAYDLAPEGENIQQADFTTLDVPYKAGRCVIGNPPYGEKMALAQKFMRKAAMIGDYIAFVLPSSQLNNNRTLKDFELVKSVPLGDVLYSGQKNVKTCFNIYERLKPEVNSKVKINNAKLKDVTIIRNDNPNYDNFDADIRLGAWGNSVAGRILRPDERKYAAEYKIKVNNPEIKQQVLDVLENADWKKETNSTAMLKIQKFHITDLLQREIPEIE